MRSFDEQNEVIKKNLRKTVDKEYNEMQDEQHWCGRAAKGWTNNLRRNNERLDEQLKEEQRKVGRTT